MNMLEEGAKGSNQQMVSIHAIRTNEVSSKVGKGGVHNVFRKKGATEAWDRVELAPTKVGQLCTKKTPTRKTGKHPGN
ncbi:hypothetical protein PAXRUDRAFT_825307 [Paxillus rubicundulus Ve08.2h10]|uniref:Uncharacterized protein n=1 Tax=Paxillus rubicundulus Ve08.2h10 TaxID=930991 RepID=A0A0D0DTD0_9AGAM|nr:hypothetical protein PAXRUDRAFT_825307 [Paxillus rubicundulus Ve08.2h10]